MNQSKISIRPQITTIVITEEQSPEEKFQNEVLRPIIKLQHELILCYFQQHLLNQKRNWDQLEEPQKKALIVKIFKTDTKLKNGLIGLIVGLFTVEEFQWYSCYTNELNRRIKQMIEQRVSDSLLKQ